MARVDSSMDIGTRRKSSGDRLLSSVRYPTVKHRPNVTSNIDISAIAPSSNPNSMSSLLGPAKAAAHKPCDSKGHNVHIRRIPLTMSEGNLKKLFARIGRVVRVNIVRPSHDNRSNLSYGFVEYTSFSDAERAVTAMHGMSVEGSKLVVELSNETRLRQRTASSSPSSGESSKVSLSFEPVAATSSEGELPLLEEQGSNSTKRSEVSVFSLPTQPCKPKTPPYTRSNENVSSKIPETLSPISSSSPKPALLGKLLSARSPQTVNPTNPSHIETIDALSENSLPQESSPCTPLIGSTVESPVGDCNNHVLGDDNVLNTDINSSSNKENASPVGTPRSHNSLSDNPSPVQPKTSNLGRGKTLLNLLKQTSSSRPTVISKSHCSSVPEQDIDYSQIPPLSCKALPTVDPSVTIGKQTSLPVSSSQTKQCNPESESQRVKSKSSKPESSTPKRRRSESSDSERVKYKSPIPESSTSESAKSESVEPALITPLHVNDDQIPLLTPHKPFQFSSVLFEGCTPSEDLTPTPDKPKTGSPERNVSTNSLADCLSVDIKMTSATDEEKQTSNVVTSQISIPSPSKMLPLNSTPPVAMATQIKASHVDNSRDNGDTSQLTYPVTESARSINKKTRRFKLAAVFPQSPQIPERVTNIEGKDSLTEVLAPLKMGEHQVQVKLEGSLRHDMEAVGLIKFPPGVFPPSVSSTSHKQSHSFNVSSDGESLVESRAALERSDGESLVESRAALERSDGESLVESKAALERSDGESLVESRAALERSDGESLVESKAALERSDGESLVESKAALERSDGESLVESKAALERSDGESQVESRAALECSDGESQVESKAALERSDGESLVESKAALERSDGESLVESKAALERSEIELSVATLQRNLRRWQTDVKRLQLKNAAIEKELADRHLEHVQEKIDSTKMISEERMRELDRILKLQSQLVIKREHAKKSADRLESVLKSSLQKFSGDKLTHLEIELTCECESVRQRLEVTKLENSLLQLKNEFYCSIDESASAHEARLRQLQYLVQ